MTNLTPRLFPSRVKGITGKWSAEASSISMRRLTEGCVGDEIQRIQKGIGTPGGIATDIVHHTQRPGISEIRFVKRRKEVHKHDDRHDHYVDLYHQLCTDYSDFVNKQTFRRAHVCTCFAKTGAGSVPALVSTCSRGIGSLVVSRSTWLRFGERFVIVE